MAEITAALVKELREMTGVGMMECKKSLVDTGGDVEKAVDLLRTRGLAAVAKKAGRATNEGLVSALVAEDGKSAAMVEVNCETDFVSRNDVFGDYVKTITGAALKQDYSDVEAFKSATVDGKSIDELLTEAIQTIGENIQVSRVMRRSVQSGAISSYIHGGGRLGVLVQFGFANAATAGKDEFKTLAKDVAMQVAAANPGAVTRDGFDSETIAHEMEIYKAKAAASGKPESIQEKIAEGNLKKFYQENTLVEQAFVKDPDKSIQMVVDAVSKAVGDKIEIIAFDRIALGQN